MDDEDQRSLGEETRRKQFAGTSNPKGYNEALQATMLELAATRKELDRARDAAMQSWLDSKPFIDDLEKLQSYLSKSKNRVSVATMSISVLESELETTQASVRSKEEKEFDTRKEIDKLGLVLDQMSTEAANLKLQADEERLERKKLKQEIRLKRQSLRTLQLMRRAVGMELEASGASAAAAHHYIKGSKSHNSTIELTHEEYIALIRRANEEMTFMDWRVSVSMEQKNEAEARRDEALRKLKELSGESRQENNYREDDGEIIEQGAEEELQIHRAPRNRSLRNLNSLQDRRGEDEFDEEVEITRRETPPERLRRSKSNQNRKVVKMKKPSILQQIKKFFVKKITKLFG